jgi:hypothetical protein
MMADDSRQQTMNDSRRQTMNDGGTMMTTTKNDAPPTPTLMSHCPWGVSWVGQQTTGDGRQMTGMTNDRDNK